MYVIHIAKARQGLFRKETHTKEGKKIPLAKIKAKEHSRDPAVRERAQFADNERKWHHK